MRAGRQIQWVMAVSLCSLCVLLGGCTSTRKDGNVEPSAGKEEELTELTGKSIDVEYMDEYREISGDGMFFEVDEKNKTAKVTSYYELEQKEFVIPDVITYEGKDYPVTEVGKDAFGTNQEVEQVYIGKNVKVLAEDAFYTCPSLKKITLPEGLTSIEEYALGACGFEELILPKSLTHLGDYACTSLDDLKKLTIEGDITNWGAEVFSECGNLEEVTFADECTVIGKGAFTNCASLKQINLPKSLKTIEPEAFWGCSALKELSLPDTLTSIGESAFMDTSIKELRMPKGISDVNYDMLDGMDNLEKLIVPSEYASSYQEEFGEEIIIETES